MKKHGLILFLLWAVGGQLFAQKANIPLNSHSEELLYRYSLKNGQLNKSLFNDLRPYNRADADALLHQIDSLSLKPANDRFNVAYLHSEILDEANPYDSKKPVLKHFYRSKANLLQVNSPDFECYVNPGIYLMGGNLSNFDKPLFINTRAAEIYGSIGKKVGFYSFVSENQMRVAPHETDFVRSWGSYPGAHLTKGFKEGGIDFLQARGSITFSPVKQIRVQFGQDRNFIGYGMRSLLLSDFATDYLFLKINTRVWRINYQNLYMRLNDRYGYVAGNQNTARPYPAKFVTLHYLSLNITDRLNIGLFESVTFHDNNKNGRGFDVNYLNPIILYRSIEHQLGDADKVMMALNAGWLPLKDVFLYGQFMINEWRLKDVIAGNGSSGNKSAWQAGLKYVDVAGISNLDFQLEYNRIRPYTYTHYTHANDLWVVNSYSHHNQPLAHPMGANLHELLLRVKAQPLKRLTMDFQLTSSLYGADSSASNWGGNIFLDYRTAEQKLNNRIGQGVATNLFMAQTLFSFQIRHQLFVDLDMRLRNVKSDLPMRNSEHLLVAAGIRFGLPPRRWEY